MATLVLVALCMRVFPLFGWLAVPWIGLVISTFFLPSPSGRAAAQRTIRCFRCSRKWVSKHLPGLRRACHTSLRVARMLELRQLRRLGRAGVDAAMGVGDSRQVAREVLRHLSRPYRGAAARLRSPSAIHEANKVDGVLVCAPPPHQVGSVYNRQRRVKLATSDQQYRLNLRAGQARSVATVHG